MPVTLKRSLSPLLITFYGLGTILGAGIYVLVGEVAATAGLYTPLAFLIASFIAGFSAFSFAELSSRFPKSAGEALYTQEAFGHRLLSTTVGVMVISIGVISAAAISRGFTGYLRVFVDVPDWLALCSLIIGLGLIASWGISESVTTISLMTAIELFGLLYILWICGDAFAELPARLPEMIPPWEATTWVAIFSGAFLAFYAYIGFEDMVNVAEEVRNPQKNMPLAIISCLVITSLLYMAVALVTLLSLPLEELAGSHAPLALLYQHKTGSAPTLITAISLFAVSNGALVQIIMGARVLYGLSSQGWLPEPLGRINPRTRTPLRATFLLTTLILIMALWLPLVTLARLTSLVTLTVFACINMALIVIKGRTPRPENCLIVPIWIPWIGFFISVVMILLELTRQFFSM
ncbi:MAG: amino acid permease [Proteobacteria bacterium]|nr:amino acid permease [Pseudomonadota bacterium]